MSTDTPITDATVGDKYKDANTLARDLHATARRLERDRAALIAALEMVLDADGDLYAIDFDRLRATPAAVQS